MTLAELAEYLGAEEPVRALRAGGFAFLNNPIRLGELHRAVRRAAEAVRGARLERAAKAELKREIAEQRRKLAATTRVKDEFLSMMSHELRTPFNAIIGFSELLLDRPAGANDATAIGFIGHILAAARHLQGQIDAILDLVAVQSESLELRKTDVPVAGLIDRALGAYRPKLEAEAIGLEIDIAPPALAVRADPKRLVGALGHLIDNAIKFSPRGGTIRLHARGADGAVQIAVADEGAGMAGDEVIRRLRGIAPGLPVVVLTGHYSTKDVADAKQAGAAAVFNKPIKLRNLHEALKTLLADRGDSP